MIDPILSRVAASSSCSNCLQTLDPPPQTPLPLPPPHHSFTRSHRGRAAWKEKCRLFSCFRLAHHTGRLRWRRPAAAGWVPCARCMPSSHSGDSTSPSSSSTSGSSRYPLPPSRISSYHHPAGRLHHCSDLRFRMPPGSTFQPDLVKDLAGLVTVGSCHTGHYDRWMHLSCRHCRPSQALVQWSQRASSTPPLLLPLPHGSTSTTW